MFIKLQLDLNKYDRIFLIKDMLRENLVADFGKSQAVKNSKSKILILSLTKDAQEHNIIYRRITEKDWNTLCSLYHTYEFSDRFRILSREENYGDLFNLVDSGLLTIEELFEVFLY